MTRTPRSHPRTKFIRWLAILFVAALMGTPGCAFGHQDTTSRLNDDHCVLQER